MALAARARASSARTAPRASRPSPRSVARRRLALVCSARAGRADPPAEAPAKAPQSLWDKVRMAWEIFFPPGEEQNARADAKRRLRMILVADRCSMSPESLSEMKGRIVNVVSDFVEVDQANNVDVSMSADPELGTLYAVSIPVKRVRGQFDDGVFEQQLGALGGSMEVEEED